MENATAPSESSTPKPSKRTFDEMTGNSNSGLPQTRKVKLSSDISDAEVLDSEGDVVLAVKKPDSDDQNMFLVSSKVLSLASPVFEKMFSPKFLEGEQVRRGERLCNVLGDDDPEAMQIILRILHHCRHDRPFQLKEPLKLATVAIHCDKYDCSNPLDVWIRGWMGDQNLGPLGICTAEGIGLLLVAAYMFRRNNAFLSSFGSRASKFLMPGFVSVWKQNELISLLPEAFTSKSTTPCSAVRTFRLLRTATLSNNVSDKLCRVQNAFHAAEETLRQRSKGFVIPGHLVCPPCDLGYKSQIRKCSCGLFLIPKVLHF